MEKETNMEGTTVEDGDHSAADFKKQTSNSFRQSSSMYLKQMYASLINRKDEPRGSATELFFGDGFDAEHLQSLLEKLSGAYVATEIPIDIRIALPTMMGAFDDLVKDSFNQCFESHNESPWNWNVYLFPTWLIGVIVRYVFLLPIRVLIAALSVLLFLISSYVVRNIYKDPERALEVESKLMWLLANSWIMCWGGVIRYEGVAPHRGANQDNVLKCLDCIWFDRNDIKDRAKVRDRISEHVKRDDVSPLLIFPEGTCVNNRYTVMFKRGAFELDAEVCPIAIKYNNIFVDAFWDSRNVSFPRHLYNLFTSWALVANVTFLPRQKRLENETSDEFAMRVQKLISETAGLEVTEFDGYFKHIRASEK